MAQHLLWLDILHAVKQLFRGEQSSMTSHEKEILRIDLHSGQKPEETESHGFVLG